jgi:GAF domain-containing protein
MSAESALSESLAALTRFYVGDGTLEESLHRVAELTVDALDPVDFVGLTMPIEGSRGTAVFTDRLSPDIDQAQYVSGEGPCLEAFETGRVVAVDSMTDPGPYPAFRAAAFVHGINSTLSLPMTVDHGTVGAMNLYSRHRAAFSEGDCALAAAFAGQASIVLANAQGYWDARDLEVSYGEAMGYRAVIEQAKGIIMGAERCGPDEAFQILRAASQRENIKPRDIAALMVTRAMSPGSELQPEP